MSPDETKTILESLVKESRKALRSTFHSMYSPITQKVLEDTLYYVDDSMYNKLGTSKKAKDIKRELEIKKIVLQKLSESIRDSGNKYADSILFKTSTARKKATSKMKHADCCCYLLRYALMYGADVAERILKLIATRDLSKLSDEEVFALADAMKNKSKNVPDESSNS